MAEGEDYLLVLDPKAEDGFRRIYLPKSPPSLPDCRFCRARYADALLGRGCLSCESEARAFDRQQRAEGFAALSVEGPVQ